MHSYADERYCMPWCRGNRCRSACWGKGMGTRAQLEAQLDVLQVTLTTSRCTWSRPLCVRMLYGQELNDLTTELLELP